jgi:hypothetical protein
MSSVIVGDECGYRETVTELSGRIFFSVLVTLDNHMADGYFLPHYVDNNFEMQH